MLSDFALPVLFYLIDNFFLSICIVLESLTESKKFLHSSFLKSILSFSRQILLISQLSSKIVSELLADNEEVLSTIFCLLLLLDFLKKLSPLFWVIKFKF